MKVLRYTLEVQKQLKSKTKPEPWLHVLLIKHPSYDDSLSYAIYAWDTRAIVEANVCKGKTSSIKGTSAKDSHKPLTGKRADDFNFAFGIVGKADTIDKVLRIIQTNIEKYKSIDVSKALSALGIKPVKTRYEVINPVSYGKTGDALAKFVFAVSKECPDAIKIDVNTDKVNFGDRRRRMSISIPNVFVRWKRPVGEERKHTYANWQGIFECRYSDSHGYAYSAPSGSDIDVIKQIVAMFS